MQSVKQPHDRMKAGAGGLFIGAALAAALAAAPITLFVWGVSPTGIFEEAVGYPYFYSLRIAFGGEHPWTPQAQITTLLDAVIQRGLSAFGYPEDSLLPRIDLFSLVAALTAAVCTWLSVAWACVNMRCSGCSLVVVASALVLFSSPAQILPGGPLWTIQPAYYVGVIPLLFLCLGMITRPNSGEPDKTWLILWAAVLAGVAAGIKITFVLFPLSVILANTSRRAWIALIAAPFIAASTYLLIVGCYYHFEWGSVAQHLDTLTSFIRAQQQTMAGVSSVWSGGSSDVVLVFVFLLPVLTIGVATVTRKWEPAAVGLVGLLSVGVATQRLYTHTLVETFAFAVLEIGVATWAINQRWDARRSLTFGAAALIAFIWAAVIFAMRTAPDLEQLRSYASSINEASAKWRLALAQSGKPILILTSGNEFHPNSVESALCKGGTDINNGVWGASPYIAGLFPWFHCAVVETKVPDLDRMAVGFTRRVEESPEGAKQRVEVFFHVSLSGHTCQEIQFPDLILV